MTSTLDAPACRPSAKLAEDTRSAPWVAEHLFALALLVWWAGPMTARFGGRGAGAVFVALALVGCLLLLSAPWRRVSRLVLALSCAVALGALTMCLAAPAGWYGADDMASYTLAAVTVPAVVAYARTAVRRSFVVAAIAIAGLAQFSQAFLPWWGGADATRPMIGTFYWWNPFAAFLLPGALLGVALVVNNSRPWRLVGWVAAPACAAGIIFSSSRTTAGLLLLGCTVLFLVCLVGGRRRYAFLRWALVLLVSGGAVVGLSGPPFFAHRAGVTAAADARAGRGETATQNGAYRLEFWTRALAVLEHHPLVGSGPHALVGASDPYVDPGLARSNLAHNGYLQALSDGGLSLGLPFLLSCVACLVTAARRLLSSHAHGDERWLRVTLPVALAVAAAHSLVDFDWSHPSDLLLASLLAALVLALPTDRQPRPVHAVPFLGFTLSLIAVAGVAVWHWDNTTPEVNRVRGNPAARAAHLHSIGAQPFRDYRWAAGVLQLAAGATGPLQHESVRQADVRWALEATASEASVDQTTAVLRARGLASLGRVRDAVDVINSLLKQLGPTRTGPVADDAAEVLAAAGEHRWARRLVLQHFVNRVDEHAGAHLRALLDVDSAAFDEVDRCAYAAVPASLRMSTADPGPAQLPLLCEQILQGALK